MSDITVQDLDKFMEHIGVELLPWQRLIALRSLEVIGEKEPVFILATSGNEAHAIARRNRLAANAWKPLLCAWDAEQLRNRHKPLVFATGCWSRHLPRDVFEEIRASLALADAEVIDVACY